MLKKNYVLALLVALLFFMSGGAANAVTPPGDVWAWGDNGNGQLGDGTLVNKTSPIQTTGLTAVTSVAEGYFHTLALKSDGTVWAVGYNGYGNLGDGTTVDKTTPVQVSGLTGVTAVANGYYHSLALKSDGTVWAWGDNASGQLGDGTLVNKSTPVHTTGLTGVTAITAGGLHSLALKSDGTVWAWGYNSWGQLGDGTIVNRLTPVQVSGLTAVTAIAGGSMYSLALKSDGTVWAWGDNGYGELGDGTTTQRWVPVQVSGITGVTVIACGYYHTFAQKSDGTVWAWGWNNHGQLGDGTTVDKATPVQVSGLAGVTAVGGGVFHTIALKSDGTVWAWGFNGYGQLGDGTTTDRWTPVQVPSLTGVGAIAGGGYHSLAIKPIPPPPVLSYSVEPSYGSGLNPSTGTASTWFVYKVVYTDAANTAPSSIRVCIDAVCHAMTVDTGAAATLHDGDYTNGEQYIYQINGLTAGAHNYSFVASDGVNTVLLPSSGALSGPTVSDLAITTASLPDGMVGSAYSQFLAVTGGTAPYSWQVSWLPGGLTYRNTLPIGLTGEIYGTPTELANAAFTVSVIDGALNVYSTILSLTINPPDTTPPVVTASQSGGAFYANFNLTFWTNETATVYYTTDGTTPTTSSSVYGAPIAVSATTTLKFFGVDASGNQSAVQAEIYYLMPGAAWAWGSNNYGQLGDGTIVNKNTPEGVLSGGVMAVAGGGNHTLALENDGMVRAWGRNSYGQLGDGTTANSTSPVLVQDAAGNLTGVTAIASGGFYSLALKSDGTVWAWGLNSSGQLGIGSADGSPHVYAVQVTGLTGVTAIAAGVQHSLALKSDGTVWAWGMNTYGNLGDGTNISKPSPVQVTQATGLTGVQSIAAGLSHSLALKSDGTVWAWGDNRSGELGTGSTTERWTPAQLNYFSGGGMKAVAAGGEFSLALKYDGTVWAWGLNSSGQLGDRSLTTRLTPVQAYGLTGASGIAAGYAHSLALKANNSIWAWGRNIEGQLGNRTYSQMNQPVQTAGPTGPVAIAAGYYHSIAIKATPISLAYPAEAPYNGSTGLSPSTGTVSTWFTYKAVYTNLTNTPPSAVYVSIDGGSNAMALDTGATATLHDGDYTNGEQYVYTTNYFSSGPHDYYFSASDGARNEFLPFSAVALSGPTVSDLVITTTTLPDGMTGVAYSQALSATGGTAPYSWSTTTWALPAGLALNTSTGVLSGTPTATASTMFRVDVTDAAGYVCSTLLWITIQPNPDTIPPVVTASVAGGTYLSSQTVSLSANESSTIYYTLNGTTPTVSSNVYGAPITIGTTTTLKFFAKDTAGNSSAIQTNVYTITGGTVWAWGSNYHGELGDGTLVDKATPGQTIGLTGVTSVAGGWLHSLALKSDGTVWAWGYNAYGQLGDGTILDKAMPVQVSGLTGVTAVAAGYHHSLALKSDGTVWAWGFNGYGQLGDGTGTQRNTPVQVIGLTGVTAIAGGGYHSLALKSDGTVWVWGFNLDGQLGDGTTTDRWTPIPVSGLTGVTAIAGGEYPSLALKSDGTVWAWGEGSITPVPVSSLTGVTAIAGGYSHSFALKSDGTVWAWGLNSSGQLGDGTTTNRWTPVQTIGLTGVTVIAGGAFHPLALKSNGTVWAWGGNWYGQLGDGTTADRWTPVQVSGLIGVAAIAGGYDHSLAIVPSDTTPPVITPSASGGTYLTSQTVSLSANEASTIYYTLDGTTPTISSNVYGAPLTIGTTTTLKFFAVDAFGNASAVQTRVYTVTGGDVWAWGRNYNGELGDGTTTDRLTPIQTTGLTGVTNVAGGWTNTLALKSDGTVWAWGWNDYGQLGDGTYTSRITPVQVSGLTGVTAIAGGSVHSLALKSDGTVWAWGWNFYGQLGDGTTTQRLTPVQVTGLTGVTAVAGGDYHSLALKSDGTVWAWGYNGDGELGDGTTTGRWTPVQVSGLTGVVSVAAGYEHSLALKSDGTVWAWGYNGYGQLGDGTIVDKTTPVQVSGLTGVTAVAAGFYHSLVLKSDGTVWAWGYNLYGQLGDGTTVDKAIPVQVTGLTGVTAVAAGGWSHSLALKSDGTVWAWGSNGSGQLIGSGQLGDGTTVDKHTPVQVTGLTGVTAVAGGYGHSLAIAPSVVADATPPTGSITINSGAASTTSTSATLTLTCVDAGGCSQMRFSNDNATWSAWEAYAASKPWTLTAGVSTKTVYAQFKDAAGNISTSYSDSIIYAASGVDLSVSVLTAPPSVATGAPFNVSNTVLNSGTNSSAASTLRIYLSTDATITSADRFLVSRSVAALAAGTSSAASTPVTLPVNLAPGVYYIGAIADATNTNIETNETNNTASQAVTVTSGVDLSVSVFSAPASMATGVTFVLPNTVFNSGVGASAASTLKIYLSTDATITSADRLLGSVAVPAIAAGSSSAASTLVTLPVNLLPGVYYIGAIADATNSNVEMNETNNTRSQAVMVSPGVALSVSVLSAPAFVATGAAFNVSSAVFNSGVGTSAASTLKIYVSTDAAITATDKLLGSVAVPVIAAGSSSSASTPVTLPVNLQPGMYYIGVIADATNTNVETNETNNTRSQAVTVSSGVDLSVSVLTAPASVATGAVFNVSNTVLNSGVGTSAASTLKIYLSMDAAITSADKLLTSVAVPVIAAGSSSAAVTPVTLPVNLAPGAYYIGAIADTANANVETNETNNTASRAITVSSGVDLSVSVLNAPASVATGATFAVSNTVLNSGVGTSAASTLKIYLSTDAAITSADKLLTSVAVPAIAAGSSSAASTPVTLPVNLSPGVYYIGAIADATNTNVETNETNNTASQAVTVSSGVDLSVSVLTAPASVATGAVFNVSNTVLNSGVGTSAASTLKIYVSTDATITSADRLLTTVPVAVPAIAAGSSSAAATSVTLPAGLAPGAYYIGAIADAANANVETNETNNTASQAITVSSGVDLSVSALSAPASVATGAPFNVSNTVLNSGTGSSAASTLKIYLSTDAVITPADRFIGSRNIAVLAVGSSSSASTPVTLPVNLAPGVYYIGAIADATNKNFEMNETNNTASQAITVSSGVDLSVSALSAPASVATGATFSVSNTVLNSGVGASAASTLRIYLSTNATITSADTFLASRSVAAIASGSSSGASTSVTLPAGLAPGVYYIGAIADATNTNIETNETNNTASQAITVTP